MKIFNSFLVCFLFLTFTNAQEESYIFEAKGEFAKELKELVEKHSKDENIEVNVYKVPENLDTKDITGVKQDKNYLAKEGERIYKNKCLKCHGEKGTKKSAYGVQKLSDMSGDDIFISFKSYYSDAGYGGSQRITMQGISASTTSEEIGYIIAYLKGEDSYIFKSHRQQNTNISRNPTSQGTYLK